MLPGNIIERLNAGMKSEEHRVGSVSVLYLDPTGTQTHRLTNANVTLKLIKKYSVYSSDVDLKG